MAVIVFVFGCGCAAAEDGKSLMAGVNAFNAITDGTGQSNDPVALATQFRAAGYAQGFLHGMVAKASLGGKKIDCVGNENALKRLSAFADGHGSALAMPDDYFLTYAFTQMYPCLK
jgi:hypothetical protein